MYEFKDFKLLVCEESRIGAKVLQNKDHRKKFSHQYPEVNTAKNEPNMTVNADFWVSFYTYIASGVYYVLVWIICLLTESAQKLKTCISLVCVKCHICHECAIFMSTHRMTFYQFCFDLAVM